MLSSCSLEGVSRSWDVSVSQSNKLHANVPLINMGEGEKKKKKSSSAKSKEKDPEATTLLRNIPRTISTLDNK